MASNKSSSGSAQSKTKSSSVPRAEPSIPNYDAQTADEITRRLRRLSQAELAKLESYERQGQGRATVLARIAALRGEAPWSGYDDMEADHVNDALKKRDGDTARDVLDYERQHKARTTIIAFAERKRDEAAGSAATTSRPDGAGKSGPRARPSQQLTPSSKSKRSSASSRKGSRDKPTARSSGAKARGSSRQGSSSGRSTKAPPSRTRARTASRPSAAGSSSPRSGKGRQASSRSKSRSSGASRSAGSSGPRPSRSGSTKRAAQTAPARARGRMTATATARSAGARTEAATGAGRAVGAAAKNSREMIGTAAQDTAHAVGTAAKTAKGPALTAGAVAVAIGGGLVLGSKLLPKRTILGIPIPGRRSRLGQAAKSISKARNGLLEAGNRVDAIGKQVSAVNDGIRRIASGPPKD